MVSRYIFSCSGILKAVLAFYTCVDPNTIYGSDPSCHVQIFCDRGCRPWATGELFIFYQYTRGCCGLSIRRVLPDWIFLVS